MRSAVSFRQPDENGHGSCRESYASNPTSSTENLIIMELHASAEWKCISCGKVRFLGTCGNCGNQEFELDTSSPDSWTLSCKRCDQGAGRFKCADCNAVTLLSRSGIAPATSPGCALTAAIGLTLFFGFGSVMSFSDGEFPRGIFAMVIALLILSMFIRIATGNSRVRRDQQERYRQQE